MSQNPLNVNKDYLAWLNDEKINVLQKLNDWNLQFVAEKLIESAHSTESNVEEHILWYKQFMSFNGLKPGISCGMFSDIIDGVWHQHILFTENYQNFCNEIFGSFIHHIPCNIMDLSEAALNEYGIWLTDYEEAYGHLPPDLARELAEAQKDPIAKGNKCNGNHSSHPGSGVYKCVFKDLNE